jgi:hypothetical protein
MVVAIGWAFVKGVDAAVKSIRNQYQARNAKFRANHPTSNRAAAGAAVTAATVRHGTAPAARAFRDDFRKHYVLRRDALRAKYNHEVVPPEAPQSPAPVRAQAGLDLDGPEYQQLRQRWQTEHDEARGVDEDQAEPPTALPARDLNPTGLRVITGGLTAQPQPVPTQGGTMPNLPTLDIRRIADVRNGLAAWTQHQSLEYDDAQAAAARARANAQWLTQFAEQSRGILDRDPATAAHIQSLIEPAQAEVKAAEIKADAADRSLAASRQSIGGVNQHSRMEEAAQATPQASSNTDVYKGN